MASLVRAIHVQANIRWAKLNLVAPDVGLRFDGTDEEPMALAFTDPDGETHIYVFTDEGKRALLAQLTGGLVVPKTRNGH